MPVLVDGNNLLHAARSAEEAGPLLGRSMLCDRLAEWAGRRGERVHVVFDGPAPEPALAKQIGNPGIAVSYGGRLTADALLVEILETDSAARRLVVVSTDREIAQAARRRRARPIRSDEFWALVRQDLARPVRRSLEPSEKLHGLDPAATDQWLRDFGFDRQDEGRPKGGEQEANRSRSGKESAS